MRTWKTSKGASLADVVLKCIGRNIYTAADTYELSSKTLHTILNADIKKEKFK